MDVEVPLAVGGADLGGIDVGQPVVGDHLPRGVEDETAQGPPLVGVGGHPPVGAVQIFVDAGGGVHQGAAVRAQRAVLLPVADIGARGLKVVGGDQGLFHQVLDALHLRRATLVVTMAEDLDHLDGQSLRLRRRKFAAGVPGPLDGRADLGGVEGNHLTVALADPGREGSGALQGSKHGLLPLSTICSGTDYRRPNMLCFDSGQAGLGVARNPRHGKNRGPLPCMPVTIWFGFTLRFLDQPGQTESDTVRVFIPSTNHVSV